MAVLFISPTDTRGISIDSAAAERIAESHRISVQRRTEIETLWRVHPADYPGHLSRIVTNRYEPAHDIMHDAYARQQENRSYQK